MRRITTIAFAGVLALAACSSSGGSLEAFCESVQAFVDLEDPFEGDPAQFSDQINAQKDALNAMVDDAPSEISDDVEAAASLSLPILDALADVDPNDDEALNQVFEEVFTDIDPADEAAAERVTEFTIAECGIDLDA